MKTMEVAWRWDHFALFLICRPSYVDLCWASSQCSLVLLLISCIRPDLNDSISFILCDDLFFLKNVSFLLGHECRDFVGCPNLAAKIDIDWVIIFTWAASMPCSSCSFCKSLTYYILLFIEFWCFVWVKYVWLTWCISMYYFYGSLQHYFDVLEEEEKIMV